MVVEMLAAEGRYWFAEHDGVLRVQLTAAFSCVLAVLPLVRVNQLRGAVDDMLGREG